MKPAVYCHNLNINSRPKEYRCIYKHTGLIRGVGWPVDKHYFCNASKVTLCLVLFGKLY